MATGKNKTTETGASVAGFLKTVKDEKKRNDSSAIVEMVAKHTKLEPKMWGPAIIGFGTCHYLYDTGREGDMPLFAFSPRANGLALYLSANFEGRPELLTHLGKHKASKGCVTIAKLEDIDLTVLKKMISHSIKHKQSLYPSASKK